MMARAVGPRSFFKFFQNFGSSNRVSHVKVAPLIDLFHKQSDQTSKPQTKFDLKTHSILDIYKIDETKKWVVAVRNNQRKQLLRRRLTSVLGLKKLFDNWNVRHYSRFTKTAVMPPIGMFHTVKVHNEDKFDKVNLSVGAYRTDKRKPWMLPVVKKAEKLVLGDDTLSKEYLSITGLPAFTDSARRLILPEGNKAVKEGRVFGCQSLSGTSALRIAAQTLHRLFGYNTYYVSKPTWGNHNSIFQTAGFTTKKEYRYWDEKTRGINTDGMLSDLSSAPKNSVIIFHSCAHGPTGSDPTKEQWKLIADVVKAKQLFPLFDTAYPGLATGDFVEDGWVPRYFVEQGLETIICQSFTINFGLCNERIGNCIFVVKDAKVISVLKSQVPIIIRDLYSSPSAHGARIASTVLNDRGLLDEWLYNLAVMTCRVHKKRKDLRNALEKLKTPGTWNHITDQIGMFSFTGLAAIQAKNMFDKHRIYTLKSGRINMCGITPRNVEYVAEAIHDSVTKVN